MRWSDDGRGAPDARPGGIEDVPAGDSVPFAPTAPRPTVAESFAQRALDWSQRFRFPVGIALNALIVGAAFLAYTASQNPASDTNSADDAETRTLAANDGSGRSPDQADGASSDRAEARRASGSFGSRQEPTTGRRPSTTAEFRFEPSAIQALDRRVVAASMADDTATRSSDIGPISSTVGPSTAVPTTARPAASASSTPTTSPATQPTSQATPTTPPIAQQEPAFIGDRVRTVDGDGLRGVTVRLQPDGGDGGDDRQAMSDTTNGSGRYGFTVEPGCFEVEFTIPDGGTIVDGSQQQRVCVGSGQRLDSIDLTVRVAAEVAAPPACDVQIGNNSYAGVEIRDSNRAWAPGYVFYGQSGNVIARTAYLGPPDDTTNPDRNQIEWTSARYGFDESDVYAVAAEDGNGNVSGRVTCSRRNV